MMMRHGSLVRAYETPEKIQDEEHLEAEIGNEGISAVAVGKMNNTRNRRSATAEEA
jgi:hypothetical protein